MDSEFSWTQGPTETNSITATVVTRLTEAEEKHWRDMLAQAWEDGFHEGRANVSHNTPCDGRLWYDDDTLAENPYRQ